MKLRSILFSLVGLAFAFTDSAPLVDLSNRTYAAVQTSIKRANPIKRTLKVYNWDVYILPTMGKAEAESYGYDGPVTGINDRFVDYMRDQGVEVNLVYDTFLTNEDMINQLRTGKVDYDLVCPSDYAIQRLMADDLIIPFENEDDYPGSTPIYDKYVSPWLRDSELAAIAGKDVYHAKKENPNIDADQVVAKEGTVNQFMRGYMWGTVGMVYNPTFHKFAERGLTADQVREDVKSWEVLWNTDYSHTAYIKDSTRDGYSAGLQHAFYRESLALKEKYENGQLSEKEYNKDLNNLLNRTDNEALNKVSDAIQQLSKNLYGYEVDRGKEEIQNNDNVGIMQSFSGDAVYSLTQADQQGRARLYYSLPDSGSNIWFDGWVMTKSALQHGVTDLAQEYIDFLSNPFPESDKYENGPLIDNVDFIGYTSFIASSEVFKYIRESYDMRTAEDAGDEVYNQLPEGEAGKDYLVKDLTYFFKGTGGSEFTDDDWKIYYPVSEKDRQLDAMFPDESILPSLIVFQDFGDRTVDVIDVWEASRSMLFPTWGYWVVLAVIVLGLIGLAYWKLRDRAIRKKRKQRIAQLILQADEKETTEKQRKDARKIRAKAMNEQAKKSLKENEKHQGQ